jgi:hypothetical protein
MRHFQNSIDECYCSQCFQTSRGASRILRAVFPSIGWCYSEMALEGGSLRLTGDVTARVCTAIFIPEITKYCVLVHILKM